MLWSIWIISHAPAIKLNIAVVMDGCLWQARLLGIPCCLQQWAFSPAMVCPRKLENITSLITFKQWEKTCDLFFYKGTYFVFIMPWSRTLDVEQSRIPGHTCRWWAIGVAFVRYNEGCGAFFLVSHTKHGFKKLSLDLMGIVNLLNDSPVHNIKISNVTYNNSVWKETLLRWRMTVLHPDSTCLVKLLS